MDCLFKNRRMPIRVSMLAARSPTCLRVEAKKREEREGGSWDMQKRRRSRRRSNSKGARKKGKVG
jgi:hypothetical protein